MKKAFWAGIIILSLLLSACGSSTATESAISAEDTQATAVAAAFTIVAETQAVARGQSFTVSSLLMGVC